MEQIDIPVDAANDLLKITKKANKTEASVGDIVTYEVNITNERTITVTNVYLSDILPPGFKYIKESAMLDSQRLTLEPTGGRNKQFSIGSVMANQTRTLKYQLVVGAGVVFGDYPNTAKAAYINGRVISNEAKIKVKIVPDALFDYATILGKVETA
ncbi:MAG: DUF11 domain-containing protein [Planctomycetes bacterium]|nr:DUF11 domain-containing protein [Planctomycetota bacterium]